VEHPEVFYTQQWALAMQRAYGSSLLPFLVLAYEDETLVGVASLATDSQQRTATFLAATTADYCLFLSPPSYQQPFAENVFSELAKAGVRRVELANLASDPSAVSAIRSAAARSGYHVFLRPAYLCGLVELGGADARVKMKSNCLGKGMFRRNANKLSQQGPVTLNHVCTWNEMEGIFMNFIYAHVGRFLVTGRISNLAHAARRRFLEELARALSSSGWLKFTRLIVGDREIAWNYGFQFSDSWFWYQPTFVNGLEALSPGYCLLTKIIIEACDIEELRVVDLGLGAEGYKERFANGARATQHGTLNQSFVRHVLTIVRYGLATFVKRSPWLESTLRKLMGRFSAGQRRLRSVGLRAFISWVLVRLRNFLSCRDEVFFYQWRQGPSETAVSDDAPLQLAPLNLETLADAAIHYEGDTETYDYLLRSAARLRQPDVRGVVLLSADGSPVHFCWVRAFQDFPIAELGIQLESPGPLAEMIFDCWTPTAFRGHGYYGAAVARTAQASVRQGRDPWIFSAGSNQSSMQGLAKTGFQHRFSMVRRKTLMIQRVTKVPCPDHVLEVSVGS